LTQIPANLAYMQQQGWDQPGAITYRFNSQGFRADEFDSGPYLVALGCSFTVGIGLPDAATWPRLVANQLGLQCANLAWGGYSADTCYRLAEYWIPELQPRYVCMLTPPAARIEILLATGSQADFEVFMPNSMSTIYRMSDPYLRHWYANETNSAINQRKNERALKQLCHELNIPCTVMRAHDSFSWNQKGLDCARDFMHAGPQQHQQLARRFIDAY
jgi:hypothetical protein